jgi:transcriptional antiterminator
MVSLTTTQRDLLHLLLTTELPIGVPTIGQQLRVTPRQVHYSLREIKTWLARHHTTLQHTPGVGIQVICSVDQKQLLLVELGSQAKFQLIHIPDLATTGWGFCVLQTRCPRSPQRKVP